MSIYVLIFALITAVNAVCNCGSGLSCCGQQCYNPQTYSCPLDIVTGRSLLCTHSSQACNGACFDPTQYSCQSGSLSQADINTNVTVVDATNTCRVMFSQLSCRTASEDPTQISAVTVANARAWLCGNHAQYCAQISSGGQYSSCNSVEQLSYAMNLYYTASQATGLGVCSFGGVAQLFTPLSTCQAMFASLSCRTSSSDPAQVDANSLSSARNWLCNTYPQFCTDIQPGGQYASCNPVEQVSYAMTQYYNVHQSQGPSACNFGGLAELIDVTPTSSSTPSTSTPIKVLTSTTATPATTSSFTICQTMWSNLTCRTSQQDPTKLDPAALSSARNWLCGSYGQYCTQINAGGQFAGCNAAEQFSYAANLYYLAFASQGSSACNFGGVAQLVANPATTTATPINVNPTPSPYPEFPAQTADLRIINNCKTTLWFEARYGGAGAPLPGQSATALRALPGNFIDYVVPDTGLPGSRFWAKYGCDDNGKNCLIGDQMQYWPNPPGGCPANGCSPPVDSLFEATWGCRPGSECNSANPTTWFDTSQVDGWTLPYKLTPVGDTSGCDCSGSNCGFKGIDASTLDVAKCPSNENLVAGGQTSVNVYGKAVSLNTVDLRIISNGTILGCMSPCKRLNWGTPYGLQQAENSGATLWMCCPTPTPDKCSPENGCVTPNACRAGPIENTQFVSAVHRMAPGVYAYSYDDGVGLHACPAGVTKYTMEFCPAGSATYPGRL